MSAADLLEDGYPHSTVQGYQDGCRGRSCPGKQANGISCAGVFVRYQGDFRWRRRLDAGETPAQIIAAEAAEAAAVVVKPPKPKKKGRPAGERKARGKTHGTPWRYQQGCHTDDCPATPTCGEVGRAYFRERRARKRAEQQAAR